MMLLDLIEKNTAIVVDFKLRDEKVQKSNEQHNIDKNFSNAILSVKQTLVHLRSVQESADFKESLEVSNKISEMLEISKLAIGQRHVKAEDTALINGKNRDINSSLTEEWKEYYKKKTTAIKETLNIVKSFASTKASSLIDDINAAAKWDVNVDNVKRMVEALKEADELVGQLKLDDSIIEFLNKMMNHQASLEDLTPDVLKWIETENMKKRIKLSFGL